MGIGKMQHECNTPTARQNCGKKRAAIANRSKPMLRDTNPLRSTPQANTGSVGQQDKQINKYQATRHPGCGRPFIPIYSQFTMKVVAPMKDDKHVRERLAYRVPTLAEAFDLSPHYIRKEIRLGKLRAYKVGSIWMVLADDARSWLAGFPTNQAESAESTARTAGSSPATLN